MNRENEDTCYLCARITNRQVWESAHKIWNDTPKLATKIARELSALIKTAYEQNPPFFCGLPVRSILSGAFYLLGFRHNAPKHYREIGQVMNVGNCTVRKSYRKWLELLGELFSDFELKKKKRYLNLTGEPGAVELLYFVGELTSSIFKRNERLEREKAYALKLAKDREEYWHRMRQERALP